MRADSEEYSDIGTFAAGKASPQKNNVTDSIVQRLASTMLNDSDSDGPRAVCCPPSMHAALSLLLRTNHC